MLPEQTVNISSPKSIDSIQTNDIKNTACAQNTQNTSKTKISNQLLANNSVPITALVPVNLTEKGFILLTERNQEIANRSCVLDELSITGSFSEGFTRKTVFNTQTQQKFAAQSVQEKLKFNTSTKVKQTCDCPPVIPNKYFRKSINTQNTNTYTQSFGRFIKTSGKWLRNITLTIVPLAAATEYAVRSSNASADLEVKTINETKKEIVNSVENVNKNITNLLTKHYQQLKELQEEDHRFQEKENANFLKTMQEEAQKNREVIENLERNRYFAPTEDNKFKNPPNSNT